MSVVPALRGRAISRDRRGSVAMLTATLLLPIMIIIAMAIDVGFYMQAEAQLNLASDAAAMYGTRVAAQTFGNGSSAVAAIAAGQAAGKQWFAVQTGRLSAAMVPSYSVTVDTAYTQSPSGFSTTVKYNGTVRSQLGTLLGYTSYLLGGSATVTISNSYVEVVMLLDNSSSMLIGATLADIVALERATPCSTQSATAAQAMGAYSWTYANGYGYNSGNKPPTTTGTNGACHAGYTGDPLACFYVPTAIASQLNNAGQCLNGGGAGAFGAHTPQAPCAFACHNSVTNNDYYGLARRLGITLRLDIVERAAAGVIQTLQTKLQSPNQFIVGVYEFNTALKQVYPTAGSGEAATDLAAALKAVQALSPVVTVNSGDTDFPTVAKTLANLVTNAGDGSRQGAPRKNLFIVTDGMQDPPSRVAGAMTSATNEQTCQRFKDKGFTVYVLYTPYLPLANPYYINTDKQYVEPITLGGTSVIINALQACASSSSTFFQASDPTAINTAMQKMLASAVNTAGRIAN